MFPDRSLAAARHRHQSIMRACATSLLKITACSHLPYTYNARMYDWQRVYSMQLQQAGRQEDSTMSSHVRQHRPLYAHLNQLEDLPSTHHRPPAGQAMHDPSAGSKFARRRQPHARVDRPDRPPACLPRRSPERAPLWMKITP